MTKSLVRGGAEGKYEAAGGTLPGAGDRAAGGGRPAAGGTGPQAPGLETQPFDRLRAGGFSTHASDPIRRADVQGLERVAQYIIRNPFSEQRMTWNPDTDTVIYRSRMHAKTKRNFEVFTSGDFIAAITQHIPDKGFQMVRYYGWYSNRARGERAKRDLAQEPGAGTGVEVIDVSDYQPRRLPSAKWRELIKKVADRNLLSPRS